jgi:hypothetical protein
MSITPGPGDASATAATVDPSNRADAIHRALSFLPIGEEKEKCERAVHHVYWDREGNPKDCSRVITNGRVVCFLYTEKKFDCQTECITNSCTCCMWACCCPIMATMIPIVYFLCLPKETQEDKIWWRYEDHNRRFMMTRMVVVDSVTGQIRSFKQKPGGGVPEINQAVVGDNEWKYSFLLLEQVMNKDSAGLCTFDRAVFVYEQDYSAMNAKWVAAMGDVARFFNLGESQQHAPGPDVANRALPLPPASYGMTA